MAVNTKIALITGGSRGLGKNMAIAIAKKGIDASEIDLLICATTTPDMQFPATANIITDKIGAKNAFGFDINAVKILLCSFHPVPNLPKQQSAEGRFFCLFVLRPYFYDRFYSIVCCGLQFVFRSYRPSTGL